MTLSGYFLTFFLTIFSELFIVFLLEGKNRKLFQVVVLANFITHPIFGFFLWNNSLFGFLELNDFFIIFIELIIVFFEAFLLFFVFRKNYWNWFHLSFLMNLVSFLLGKIIF
jgi:hypothetical protein